MNGISSCCAGQTQGWESQTRHEHIVLSFLTKAMLLSFSVALMLPQQALLAREAPTATPAPVVSNVQSLTEGVIMRDGMIYPSYAVQGKVYLAGTWYDTGFSSDAEYFAAMGLNPDGTFYPPLTQDIANRYIWGYEFPDDESAAAEWGYASLADLLADAAWGGPYDTMEELYVDWINQGYITLAEEGLSPTLTNVSGNPAALVEALQLLAQVAPSQIQTALDGTEWDSSTAQSLLIAAQNITDQNISGPLAGKLFAMAVSPGGLLYDSRGEIDFSGADLTSVNLAGMDLSGLQLSAAQLNTYIPNSGGWVPMHETRSFQGTNFSGLDMTGFNPVRGITVLSPGLPSDVGYANYSNANFSGATNLDVNVLAKATSLSGAVLTGTGISREALSSAMVNFAAAEFFNWGTWTQTQRDSWVNSMLQNVTF